MRTVALSTPEFGFVVATRAALAFGIGLLISDRLDRARRRRIGKAFIAVGALSTVPAALLIARRRKAARR
jgi:uncharacterized PurR-regulated membrane protein YhhQ (DUF165 family)